MKAALPKVEVNSALIGMAPSAVLKRRPLPPSAAAAARRKAAPGAAAPPTHPGVMGGVSKVVQPVRTGVGAGGSKAGAAPKPQAEEAALDEFLGEMEELGAFQG